jgi:hypothetical protein
MFLTSFFSSNTSEPFKKFQNIFYMIHFLDYRIIPKIVLNVDLNFSSNCWVSLKWLNLNES